MQVQVAHLLHLPGLCPEGAEPAGVGGAEGEELLLGVGEPDDRLEGEVGEVAAAHLPCSAE